MNKWTNSKKSLKRDDVKMIGVEIEEKENKITTT